MGQCAVTSLSAYHVGIVVPRLETAAAELSEQLGLSWAPAHRAPLRVEQDGHISVVDLLYTYSRSSRDGLMLELIQEIPGTPWVAGPEGALHHVGFWSDQFNHSLASLDAGGQREVSHVNASGETQMFSYHHLLDGRLRVELVDAEHRRDVLPWSDGQYKGP